MGLRLQEILGLVREHDESKGSANGSSSGEASHDSAAEELRRFGEVVGRVSKEHDADILLYNGIIGRPIDQQFVELLRKHRRRPNVVLLLVTAGGDGDAAFRIARALQRNYKKFVCYVSGYCKSAGTLIAVGAHELIVCDHGELGPLDVQIYKKDEIGEMESGAVVQKTLETLYGEAFSAFEQFMLETKKRSGGSISMRMAAKIATELTVGLLAQVFRQIEPMHVGETGRAMNVSYYYARLLIAASDNVIEREDGLYKLVVTYPSHGFVIDREQAQTLFRRVRRPDEWEQELACLLGDFSRVLRGNPDGSPVVSFLTDQEGQREIGVDNGGAGEESDEGPDDSELGLAETSQGAGGEPVQASQEDAAKTNSHCTEETGLTQTS